MSFTWEEFVKAHAGTALNAALRVVANAADAEDVVQEVFLEIFKGDQLSKFAGQPALLRTLATRRALDRLRKKKSASRIDQCDTVGREHEPSEYAVAAELDQRLRSSLAELPPREAEVFCLSVFEGYSSSEIAAVLGISRGAIAKSLCLARARLSLAFRNTSEVEQ